MSRAPAPPPLPAAPRPRKPADVPSHAEFLLDQVRASLAQLHQGQALDAVTYRDLESRLSRAVLRQPPLPTDIGAGTGSSEADSEEVQLGKRNAWVRKAMTETDVLPNIVETALSTVAGPFLSGTAIDVIVELVSQSQKTIAEAVTDPKKQQVASTSAFVGLKEAHGGMTRGISAANTSLAEMKQRLEEKRLQGEAKKQEKKERKDIKRELKEERSAFRKQIAAGAGQDRLNRHLTRTVFPSSEAPTGDTDASCPACGKPMGQADSKAADGLAEAAGTAEEEPIAVDVTSASLEASRSTVTTTFTALPDLKIVSTLIISGGHEVAQRATPTDDSAITAMPTQTGGAKLVEPKQMGIRFSEPSRVKGDARRDQPSLNTDIRGWQTTPLAIDRDDKISGGSDRSRDSSISDQEATQSGLWQLSHPRASNHADQPFDGTPRAAAAPVPPIPARPAVGERSVSDPDWNEASDHAPSLADPEDAVTGSGQVIDVTGKKRKGWKNRLLG